MENTAPHGPHALTGVAEVDRVIGSLDELDQLDLAEHLPVFRSAHDALRAALDEPNLPDQQKDGA